MITTYDTRVTQERLFPEVLNTLIRSISLDIGVRLHQVMVEESKKRADGIGGTTGAVNTGTLANSIAILETDDDRVVVGTRLRYARTLAYGLPTPTAELKDIQKWVDRKRVPRSAYRVWQKVTTRGPMPNPFHDRAKRRIVPELDSIIERSVRRLHL
jgi:hypothetical protein